MPSRKRSVAAVDGTPPSWLLGRRVARAATASLTATGSVIGAWAAFGPRSFYDAFPGLGSAWVATDGPFNEHLVRDVGGLYLALSVVGIATLLRDDEAAMTTLGAAWTCFSVPHLAYHLAHARSLDHRADQVAEVGVLTALLLLALLLLMRGVPRALTPAETSPGSTPEAWVPGADEPARPAS